MTQNEQVNEVALNIAIGYEVAQLLNLKFNATGKLNTSLGAKSVQGLGASIAKIIEEQTERLK